MQEDRLRHDRDEVEQLEDIIEARDEGTSHLARDVDAADEDFNIPEDIDVDDALTFPHPKHRRKPGEDIDLMDTPRKDDIDIDWRESQHDLLPSDYEDDYDDALTTNLYDEDTVAEEQIDEIADVEPMDLVEEMPMVEEAPGGFRGGEAESEEAAARSGGRVQPPTGLESAVETASDASDVTIAEKFADEVRPEEARQVLWHAEPEQTEE